MTAAMLAATPVCANQKALVIVDASNAGTSNAPSLDRRWYVFRSAKDSQAAEASLRRLDDRNVNEAPLDPVKKDFERMAADSDPRVYLDPGDTFRVIVLRTSDQLLPSIEISEKRRETRFAQDFGTLIKLAVAIAKAVAETRVYKLTEKSGQTNGVYKRSTITVDVKTSNEKETSDGGPEQFDPATMTADTSVSVALVNGPKEHWFISADVPITKTSEAKYDETGHTIGTKSTPTTAYAGVNLMLGDVIAETRECWTDGLMLKAMAKLSKRPADSYGGGIGYRFPAQWHIFGYELNDFSVFAAYLRTRNQTSRAYENAVRGGISLNLDKALDWFKSSSK